MDATRERREIKSRIGVVPQETNLDADLTVRENLLQQARYFGIDSGRGGRAGRPSCSSSPCSPTAPTSASTLSRAG